MRNLLIWAAFLGVAIFLAAQGWLWPVFLVLVAVLAVVYVVAENRTRARWDRRIREADQARARAKAKEEGGVS